MNEQVFQWPEEVIAVSDVFNFYPQEDWLDIEIARLSENFTVFGVSLLSTGYNCQVNIDECASNPCLNQGTCFDDISGYTCHCVLPYTGKNCQTVLAPCSPNPCENAAVCKESPNFESYTCLCAPGWQGQQCTIDIDECISKPCMNHGLCHNTQGSYMCECPPGFSGMDCEEDIDDCLASEYASHLLSPLSRGKHAGSRRELSGGYCLSCLTSAVLVIYPTYLIIVF
ncbi:hypothetical protein P7K49_016213 [Saguinus oedipus]|uniref:EGF-like domain-containing protein n=1 Tax=Saguinus oedipus TaxID=9490 RepID=A0ABQ9VBE7_SAGOE|nr:hypothetical protein P7K49_016213 [Saguinus oedipus]